MQKQVELMQKELWKLLEGKLRPEENGRSLQQVQHANSQHSTPRAFSHSIIKTIVNMCELLFSIHK